VELIDGAIVEMTAIGNPHASGARRLDGGLNVAWGGGQAERPRQKSASSHNRCGL
jgi:hypothetical protein